MSQNAETNPADVFRRKFEEGRERRQAEGFPMEFAGYPCRVRQLSRLHFIRAGRMPEYLTRIIIERNKRNDDEADRILRTATAEQTIEAEIFMRDAVCAVLIEPRVAPVGRAPEGGYLYGDLVESTPEFAQAVYEWIMSDCPLPAEEKGEEVLGVKDLENFPDEGGVRAGAQSGGEGEVVGATAARVDAADGERVG